jgi:hypothetical protein
MNLTDLKALSSFGLLKFGEDITREILPDDEQSSGQSLKDLFGKDYETYSMKIFTDAYDKPLKIAIGIPKNMSDFVESKSYDNASETNYYLFEAEMERLKEVALQLAEKYPDEFIAVKGGEVLDHDKDELTLTKRIYSRYPNDFVLVTHTQQIGIPTEVWLESPE